MVHTKLYTVSGASGESSRPIVRYVEGDMEAFRVIPQSETQHLSAVIPQGVAGFYFSGRHGAQFTFRQGAYVHRLPPESVLMLFYPARDSSFEIYLEAGAELFIIHLPLDAMHRLFTQNDHELHFLAPQNMGKEYFEQRSQVAGVASALHQIHSATAQNELENLMVISRTYEILYHHFKADGTEGSDKCPFLADEDNVERIRQAKRILHDELRHPPNIKDLARRVGMNETHLKSGFKRIYGCPIYTWVIEQRLSAAHDLFTQGAHNVNEVAEQIGYSNVSQFISAFKKRYGVTPGTILRASRSSSMPGTS